MQSVTGVVKDITGKDITGNDIARNESSQWWVLLKLSQAMISR